MKSRPFERLFSVGMGFCMGFLKSSKTEHNPFLFKNRKYEAKTAQIKRFKQLILELLGRFELREDDFSSSSLLLFQHFMYYFCAVLVLAYPYSSFFIFLSKGKTKGKTLEDPFAPMFEQNNPIQSPE